jgi:hypothetical protein
MSKEIALLKRAFTAIDSRDFPVLCKEIKELLAQPEQNTKLTLEQKVIITGFTGVLSCHFSDLHKDVEKRLGQSVYTHEFADKDFGKMIKELYQKDFLAMITE